MLEQCQNCKKEKELTGLSLETKKIQIKIDNQIIYVDTVDFTELKIIKKDNEFKVIKNLVSENPPIQLDYNQGLTSNQPDDIDFPDDDEEDNNCC